MKCPSVVRVPVVLLLLLLPYTNSVGCSCRLENNNMTTITRGHPQFAGEGTNVTVTVGRDATLVCTVHNLHNYKVAWLRVDTQTILSIAGHVITKNARVAVWAVQEGAGEGRSAGWGLQLRGVTTSDAGRYMCQLNTEPMITQTHVLTVVVPPDILVEASSGEVVVQEGQTATLTCSAIGTPAPTLTWRREDGLHFRTHNDTLVSRWSGSDLVLDRTSRQSSGAYLCIASNGVPPSVSRRVKLRVMFPPSVWPGAAGARVEAGSPGTLQCVAEAEPPPDIYWTHNGAGIQNGSSYSVVWSSRGYRHTLLLKVTRMSLAEAGQYRCHVTNELGAAHAELYLQMLTTTSTTTTTTSTTSTTSTTTTQPPTTTNRQLSVTSTTRTADPEVYLEHLQRGEVDDTSYGDPYVVLSQHQMQNLEQLSTI